MHLMSNRFDWGIEVGVQVMSQGGSSYMREGNWLGGGPWEG